MPLMQYLVYQDCFANQVKAAHWLNDYDTPTFGLRRIIVVSLRDIQLFKPSFVLMGKFLALNPIMATNLHELIINLLGIK